MKVDHLRSLRVPAALVVLAAGASALLNERAWPPSRVFWVAAAWLALRIYRLLPPGGRRTVPVVLGVALALGWSQIATYSALGSTNVALVWALTALSLVVLTGWVGQISLAQASFVGIGAYTTGLVVRAWGIPFPLTLPIAAGAAAAAAAALGAVALRVRGLYLAVATLIFAWMMSEYLFNQPWLAGVGGAATAPAKPLGKRGTIPYFDFTNRTTYYYVALAALAAAMFAVANLRDSKTGRAWFAVRGSEVAAASLGIGVVRYKLAAFAVAGFLAGAAGNLTMTNEAVASSTSFLPSVSLFYLAIAVVGGLASIGGALASALVFASLQEISYRVDFLDGFVPLVSAVLLGVVLLFFPAGLAGLPPRVSAAARSVRASAAFARFERWREWARLEVRSALFSRRSSREPSEEDTGAERSPGLLARAVSRPAAAIGRRAGALRRGRGASRNTPDALAAAVAEIAEIDSDSTEAEPERRPALAYVPGTATRVQLPPRSELRPILAAEGITVRFGGLTAVDDVSLEVREGEIVGLIGPNGAGKTTLFNAIAGLNSPTSGRIHLFGEDVTNLDVHRRAARGVGRTFQAIQLFSQLSVFDNLLVASHVRNRSSFAGHLLATGYALDSERAVRERVAQVVKLVGLDDVADRRVAGLPFGVLRLVEMARALVTGAPFVMLDEPASGLDNRETDRFADLLLWVRQTLGVTLLLIEHDVRMVTGLSDYMYVVDRGRLIAEGTPADVQRNQAVIEAYLGQAAHDGAPAPGPDTLDAPVLVDAGAGSVS